MRKGRFSEEQIINVLKEHQAGIPLVELCRGSASRIGNTGDTMTDSPTVCRLVSRMPDFWHAEAKAMVARHIDAVNRSDNSMALDARPDSLDRDINRFFHGDQTVPMSTSPSSAMPASLRGDNFMRGGYGNGAHNGHGNGQHHAASDQYGSREFFDFITQHLVLLRVRREAGKE